MIYILIPVYNEEGNILNLNKELSEFKFDEDVNIVFSDDGSTDNTISLIKSEFTQKGITILGDGINRGPGHAFNNGFEWILKNANESDIVVTLEADCTSDLSILSNMISINRMNFDLVLASVYAQGGGFDTTTFFRRLISSTANLLYRFVFKIQVQTISSFYRVYSISLLKKIKSKHITLINEKGFICMLEILIKAISCEANIIEVPMVLHSNKRVGESKMKIVKTTLEYLKFLIKIKLNRDH